MKTPLRFHEGGYIDLFFCIAAPVIASATKWSAAISSWGYFPVHKITSLSLVMTGSLVISLTFG